MKKRNIPVDSYYRDPNRKIGLIRIGKFVLLAALLVTTTATVGSVGESVSNALAKNNGVVEQGVAQQSIVDFTFETPLWIAERASETADKTALSVETSAASAVSNSQFTGALGLAAVLFWLGLAAVNLRRQGVKDFRGESRAPSHHAAIPAGAVRG